MKRAWSLFNAIDNTIRKIHDLCFQLEMLDFFAYYLLRQKERFVLRGSPFLHGYGANNYLKEPPVR